MKLRRLLTLAFCLMMTVSAVAFTVNAQEENAKYEVGEGYISFDFNDITGGIVNGKPNATIEKNVAFEGKTAVKFTPTPETFDGSSYTLDCYALGKHESKGVTVNIPEYRYLGITYYYAPKDTPVTTEKLKVNLLPGSSAVIKSTKTVESHKPLVAGEWTEAYFDFSDITLNPDNKKPILVQLHFYPFASTPLTALTAEPLASKGSRVTK